MKVYVGTFGKYNAGSVDGGWLDLDTFGNFDDFVVACRKLHRDEADPELMVQDVERDGDDWQAGFTGEALSKYSDYWRLKAEAAANGGKIASPIGRVIKNEAKNGVEIHFHSKPSGAVLADLKAHGWRWSRFGGCWYHNADADALAYAEGVAGAVASDTDELPKITSPRPKVAAQLEAEAKKGIADYRAWLEADRSRVAGLWNSDIDRHLRGIVAAVTMDNGSWLTIDKADIETRHCEGEDDGRGRSMAEAKAGCDWFCTETGFKNANNIHSPFYTTEFYSNFSQKIENWMIKPFSQNVDRVVLVPNPDKMSSWQARYYNTASGACRLSEREWKRIRIAWAWAIISHRRRVNAYWRRFGASKLHTWTYWTEA